MTKRPCPAWDVDELFRRFELAEGLGREAQMARCDVCGNDYDKSFDVVSGGSRHTFDSFECAIHKLAPQCVHCGCRIIGHGVEAAGRMYCCANCARQSGVSGVDDRV